MTRWVPVCTGMTKMKFSTVYSILLARYPSLRKYFAEFIHLPFVAAQGSEDLTRAINLVRLLDVGEIKKLPQDTPMEFIPKELHQALKDQVGHINRNAWEMGLALAIKDAMRSGNLYLPQSKQHVSFWNFMLNENQWKETKETSYVELKQPQPHKIRAQLVQNFYQSIDRSKQRFEVDSFAEIQDGKLRLHRDDKLVFPKAKIIQKAIDTALPTIRIEQLLMEVDQATRFSRHFIPVQDHQSRPKEFYKTLLATIISQATNLGVVSMSFSVKGITVDMLRHVLQQYIREETLTAASTEIVNHHHLLPLSSLQGDGTLSSSDGQRFKMRADSLLASYYPRYYGYGTGSVQFLWITDCFLF